MEGKENLWIVYVLTFLHKCIVLMVTGMDTCINFYSENNDI